MYCHVVRIVLKRYYFIGVSSVDKYFESLRRSLLVTDFDNLNLYLKTCSSSLISRSYTINGIIINYPYHYVEALYLFLLVLSRKT